MDGKIQRKRKEGKVSKEIIHYMLRAYFSVKKIRKIVHLARKGMSKI